MMYNYARITKPQMNLYQSKKYQPIFLARVNVVASFNLVPHPPKFIGLLKSQKQEEPGITLTSSKSVSTNCNNLSFSSVST